MEKKSYGYKSTHDFTNFKTVCAFLNAINDRIIKMNIAEDNQILTKRIRELRSKTRLSSPSMKKEKETFKNRAIFSVSQILAFEQILQIRPIANAQVKTVIHQIF